MLQKIKKVKLWLWLSKGSKKSMCICTNIFATETIVPSTLLKSRMSCRVSYTSSRKMYHLLVFHRVQRLYCRLCLITIPNNPNAAPNRTTVPLPRVKLSFPIILTNCNSHANCTSPNHRANFAQWMQRGTKRTMSGVGYVDLNLENSSFLLAQSIYFLMLDFASP